MTNPEDSAAIDEIGKITGCQVTPFIGSSENIVDTINRVFFIKEYLAKM